MDDILKSALEFSHYNQTLNIQRQLLKDKLSANLTYGSSGGIFKIDQTLITFVHLLLTRGRNENVPLIDLNNNPILIQDLTEFSNIIEDKYFTAMNEYFSEYNKLKKNRSVETLVSL